VTREEKIREARRLKDAGWSAPEIGHELGVNESTVRNWYLGGDCVDCGGPTTYDSAMSTVERCIPCQIALQHAEKFWTEQTVIDAIQRYAQAHGRAPTADEWVTADMVNGYPPRSSVYRSSTARSSAPFASWQDALAAAGFPGANTGRRTYREVHMATPARHGYVVLHETADGTWEVVSNSSAGTQIAALNDSLNGTPPTGRWVAVPGQSWRPRELRPRTIYDWAEETEPTTAA